MGYYTDYRLEVRTNGEDVKVLCDALDDLEIFDGIDEYTDTICAYTNAKWYEWETDMCELSVKFPKAFFTMDGSGEEEGDLWTAYIQNGAIQNCPAIITYDPYDPQKMRQLVQPLVPNFKAPVADLI